MIPIIRTRKGRRTVRRPFRTIDIDPPERLRGLCAPRAPFGDRQDLADGAFAPVAGVPGADVAVEILPRPQAGGLLREHELLQLRGARTPVADGLEVRPQDEDDV